MRFAKMLLFLAALVAPALMARAADLAVNDSPYSPIVARNIFGLLPIPTNPPVDPNATPATPPPKIVPNGLMNLFGVAQALFKVSYPPAGGQPAHDESYMLAAGESQDNIEVVKIDMASSTITFNNNGTVQDLPLAAAPKITTPAAPVGGPGGGPPERPGGIPRPMMGGPRGGVGAGIGGGGPAASAAPSAAGSQAATDANGVPDISANSGNIVNGVYNPGAQSDGLSPEARALLIENNYMQAKQNNSPTAALFPPTALRGQSDAALTGGEGNANTGQ